MHISLDTYYYLEIPTFISRPNLVPSIMNNVMINFSSKELSLIINKGYRDLLELNECLERLYKQVVSNLKTTININLKPRKDERH